MIRQTTRIVFVALVLQVAVSSGQTVNNSRELHQYLFSTMDYSTKIRPVQDQAQPLQVGVSFSLSTLQDIDEVKQHVTLVGALGVTWTDEILQWTPSMYGGIGHLNLLQDDIWHPMFLLRDPKEELNNIGFKFIPVKVLFNGTVFWFPPGVLTFACDMNVRYFPHDMQTCNLDFAFAGLTKTEANLYVMRNSIALDEYKDHGEWDLVSTTSSIVDVTLNKMPVQFFHNELKLKRRSSFTVLHSVLPVILLSVINILVFVLPADSGEKISFSITMFLTFAIFISMLSTALPRNSLTLPLYSIYLVVVNILSTIYVLLTVLTLRVFHTPDARPVPRILCKIVKIVTRSRKIQIDVALPEDDNCNVGDDPHKHGTSSRPADKHAYPEDELATWTEVSKTLDSIFFWTFLLLLIILVVVFAIIGNMQ